MMDVTKNSMVMVSSRNSDAAISEKIPICYNHQDNTTLRWCCDNTQIPNEPEGRGKAGVFAAFRCDSLQ